MIEIFKAVEGRAGGIKHRGLPRRRDRSANAALLTLHVQMRSVTSLHGHASILHVAHVDQARVLDATSLRQNSLTIVLHESVQPSLMVHVLQTLVMCDHHVVLSE